jgi:hypothetical protein
MVPLARRNLLAEKGRFALSIGGVGFAVLLILIVLSLYRGWSDVGRFYERLPGDVWVSQPGTSDPFHSTSFLPARDAPALARIDGVQTVIPVYARHIAFADRGRELDVFAMALAAPAVVARRSAVYLPPAGGINIDRVLARQADVGVGDPIVVLGRRLIVDALIMGVALVAFVRQPWLRVPCALWPAWVGSSLILTGNHFWADIGVAAQLVAVTAPATTAFERLRPAPDGRIADRRFQPPGLRALTLGAVD